MAGEKRYSGILSFCLRGLLISPVVSSHFGPLPFWTLLYISRTRAELKPEFGLGSISQIFSKISDVAKINK